MTGTYGEYGTLIVCGDYQGDLEAIAKVLTFEFDQGDKRDQRFVVHDGGIKPEDSCGAFPLVVVQSKMGALPANESPELPDEEEWDCDDYEYLSVPQLSKTIAPLLTRGTLELVLVRAYKTRRIPVRKTCDPFGWLGSTPKPKFR